MSPITTIHHPLIDNAIAHMRDVSTPSSEFRRLAKLASRVAAVEVLRSLSTERRTVTTPIQNTEAQFLVTPTLCVVGVLRAALIMVDAVVDLVPEAVIGHIGIARDETTALPREYLVRLPRGLDHTPVLVVDPMLATGGSAIHALDVLVRHGASAVDVLSLIAAPEGAAAVAAAHPNVTLWTCALDERLNDRNYIVPGLGDAGDRLFGTL